MKNLSKQELNEFIEFLQTHNISYIEVNKGDPDLGWIEAVSDDGQWEGLPILKMED